MPDVVKRGYMPSDDKEFIDQIEKLREAGEEGKCHNLRCDNT